MPIVRPRLNDYYEIPITQEEVDFAIPFFDEDIPLYLDPFLLWKSPSQQDNALHSVIIDSFNYLGFLYKKDKNLAVKILKDISECDEVGLGDSKIKHGKKISKKLSEQILSTFKNVPQVNKNGFAHIEEAQLLIEGFSKDRISDIACNFLESFLIDYTIQQCEEHKIPTKRIKVTYFDTKKNKFVNEENYLPVNLRTEVPIILVPKRWLRFGPWINFDDYFDNYLDVSKKIIRGESIPRINILEYNRKNYDVVRTYIKQKKLKQSYCKNDPLFTLIPILSSKRKLKIILKLPLGKIDNADKEYENNLCPLLASMLYPELDFAQPQSRTESGILIRDLIFYNNTSHPLLKEIYQKFDSKQIVFELKNVQKIDTDHVDQLNRYLSNEFGSFGVIFTRNKPPKNVFRNTISLWSGQRKCILILDDTDLEAMCQVYENKQRKPIDVINKKYREFIRACPA